MNTSECVISLYLFTTEFCYNMGEIEGYRKLTQAVDMDESYQDTISQIDEFEKFLVDMKITVEKKKILISREDLTTHLVYINM